MKQLPKTWEELRDICGVYSQTPCPLIYGKKCAAGTETEKKFLQKSRTREFKMNFIVYPIVPTVIPYKFAGPLLITGPKATNS